MFEHLNVRDLSLPDYSNPNVPLPRQGARGQEGSRWFSIAGRRFQLYQLVLAVTVAPWAVFGLGLFVGEQVGLIEPTRGSASVASHVDYDHPSYQDGYTAGWNLARSVPASSPKEPCLEVAQLATLSGGPVGGDGALAMRGCYDGFYDSNYVPEVQRAYPRF